MNELSPILPPFLVIAEELFHLNGTIRRLREGRPFPAVAEAQELPNAGCSPSSNTRFNLGCNACRSARVATREVVWNGSARAAAAARSAEWHIQKFLEAWGTRS
jgi:hypothetical protein